jgi:transcription elongation factor GreA
MEKLRVQLDYLKGHQRPRLLAWLAEAMSEGYEDEDVTEIETARAELTFLEERIHSLEHLLGTAEVLVTPEDNQVVGLGSRVTVLENGTSEPETYRIVSPAEADPLNGSISNQSPLGRNLLGHSVDDTIVVQSPDGPIEFRLVAIN